MKRIEFRGTLTEVHQQLELWKAANPLVTIHDVGPPVGGARRDERDLMKPPNWTISVEYDDPS